MTKILNIWMERKLQYCIREMHLDGEWPEQYKKAILPYSLLNNDLLFGSEGKRRRRSEKGLLDLDPEPNFDLVIVDEAHHIRNQGTANHEAVRFFCEKLGTQLFSLQPLRFNSVVMTCLFSSMFYVRIWFWMRRVLII